MNADPTSLLIDADAWICLRMLGWVGRMVDCPQIALIMSERIFLRELNDLRGELDTLQSAGVLRVARVIRKTKAASQFKAFTRAGADKGEAESIAWASVDADVDVIFVSNDTRARTLAGKQKVATTHVFGLPVWGASRGDWSRAEVEAQVARWEDEGTGFCRPSDFTTLEESSPRSERQVADLI